MPKILYLLIFLYSTTLAQPGTYTTANAHSHNDYEQPVPLYTAYYSGFGSIEADIFLRNDSLLVAHTVKDLDKGRTLEALYLKPLQAFIENNKGFVYADSTRRLQLMIDIKTDAVSTLNKLVAVLQKYPSLTNASTLRIVISGSRPDPSTFVNWPAWIWFDGVLGVPYSKEALSKIAMLSDDLKKYTKWNGSNKLSSKDWSNLKNAVESAHQLQKTVRFWGGPDFMDAWQQFIDLKVDYINTDSIKALSAYLNGMAKD